MYNNCEYCGTAFKAKRASRKYCSDNCKQLAYFKRNGMVFGQRGEVNVKDLTIKRDDSVKQLNGTFSVKKHYVNPDTEKDFLSGKELYPNPDRIQESVSVKQPLSVKQNVNVKDNIPLLSEKQMQELTNRISLALADKIQQAILNVKKELDVKYASLYGKEPLAQNTQPEVLLCSQIPFMGVTKYQSDPAIRKQDEIIVKHDVKCESGPLTSNTENTSPENDEHFTLNDNDSELPETMQYLELPEEEEQEDESEDDEDCEENEEDDTELYDMTSEKVSVKEDNVKDDTESEKPNVKDEYINELHEKLRALTLKGEKELQQNTETESQTAQVNDTELPAVNGQQEPQTQQEEQEPAYEWVHSRFLRDIKNDWEEDSGRDFWDNIIPSVDWVNVRLHCIMKNIVRLTDYTAIDRQTILQLNDALGSLINSNSFNDLPSDYPFRQVTMDVTERISELANSKAENIPLRISFKTKAKLVSMCQQMWDNVALIKFADLNFDETNNRMDTSLDGMIERSFDKVMGKQEPKKKGGWKEAYRQHVEEGSIEDDDLDDLEDDDNEDEASPSNLSKNPYDDRWKYYEKHGKFPPRLAA